MKHTNIFLGLLVTALTLSCVKEPQDIPDGIDQNPLFRLQGQLGPSSINIEAGIGQWTMQPIVENVDSNISYTAIFSKDGCLDQCVPSIKFRFYRQLPSIDNVETDFYQTIQAGSVEYVKSDLERDSFKITLATHPGLFMSGFSSWIDSNNAITVFHPEFTGTVGNEQNLNVCFQSFAYTGCQFTNCINFDPSTLIPCLAYIEPRLENGRFLNLAVRPEGTPPFDITWFNGSKFSTILLPLPDTVSVVYTSVKVVDALGNSTEISQSIYLEGGIINPCYFPITLTSHLVNNSSPFFSAGRVEIIYTDENGMEWTSSGGVQDPASIFLVHALEDAGISPLGQQSYKAEISFTVSLFNRMTGEEMLFDVQDGVIALSHN